MAGEGSSQAGEQFPAHLLTAVLTGSSSVKNMSAVDVLAVPSAPTMSTAFLCLCSIRSKNRARVESIVGTSKLEKSSTSVEGYSHRGGRHLRQGGKTGGAVKGVRQIGLFVLHFAAGCKRRAPNAKT